MARPRKNDEAAGPHSQTLDRGIRLLETLSDAEGPRSLDELATTLGVHRSIAYRMIRTLEDHRLLRRRADGRYEPGVGLALLARGVSRSLQTAALPELTVLANEVGMTAFLVVRDDTEAVTLVSVEPRRATAHVSYRPGTRHPVDRGAAGLALLAGGPPTAGERAEIAEARVRGYATSHGEVLPGLASVAAAITRGSGDVVAALAVVFLDGQADPTDLGNRLIQAARAVAAALP